MIKPSARRIKSTFNLGSISSFEMASDGALLVDEKGLRKVSYRSDSYTDNFPLIYHPGMLDACCEMNLFLIQRARGEYSTKRNRKDVSSAWSQGYVASMRGEPLHHKTVDSISKDLKLFLDFLDTHGSSYLEVVVLPTVSDDRELLPIWKYQRKLVERVKNNDLGWGTAQRMIRRVREFYVWSFLRGVINKLPFEVEMKAIRKQKSNDYDVLYAIPSRNTANTSLSALVSDLSIPKKHKQKAKRPDGLQPFSPQELTALLQTEVAQHRTFGLFLKCAYLAGLRSFEVVQIDYSDIENPAENPEQLIYCVRFIRKHHMQKPINITRSLMGELFKYTQSDIWTERRIKHETKYGMDNKEHPLPLFMNSSGERMASTSPSDTIRTVRKEQRARGGEVLKRSYHDLRATFGTYLAMYLIEKEEDPKRVRAILRKWMGHENSKTTEAYIDFAKASDPSEFGEMHDWISDIYTEVQAIMESE